METRTSSANDARGFRASQAQRGAVRDGMIQTSLKRTRRPWRRCSRASMVRSYSSRLAARAAGLLCAKRRLSKAAGGIVGYTGSTVPCAVGRRKRAICGRRHTLVERPSRSLSEVAHLVGAGGRVNGLQSAHVGGAEALIGLNEIVDGDGRVG